MPRQEKKHHKEAKKEEEEKKRKRKRTGRAEEKEKKEKKKGKKRKRSQAADLKLHINVQNHSVKWSDICEVLRAETITHYTHIRYHSVIYAKKSLLNMKNIPGICHS